MVFLSLNYLMILLLLVFINFDFLLPHMAHFDENIVLPFLVFKTFELTLGFGI